MDLGVLLAELCGGGGVLNGDFLAGIIHLANQNELVTGLQFVELGLSGQLWSAFSRRKREGCRGEGDEGCGCGED